MVTEAVFWYIIRAVSGTVSIFTAYVVLKYINKKALSMRTIFDEIIKDYIYLKILDWMSNIVVDIVVNFLIPVNKNVALLIIISRHTIKMAGICQLIAIMLIRYLYVFHQTLLNNECLVMFLTRLLVACTALTTTLIGDLKNTDDYYLMIGKSKENEGFVRSKTNVNVIVVLICLIVLTITEYKINKFKKSVDSQQQFDEMQAGEEERNCIHYFRKKSDRIIFAIIFMFLLYTFVYSIVNLNLSLSFNLKRSMRICIQNLVMQNIIPIIFIVLKPKLFCFFKAEFFSIFRLCNLKKNQIEPMIQLNVI